MTLKILRHLLKVHNKGLQLLLHSFFKEVLHLRWNERHLRAYFETLMALLQT